MRVLLTVSPETLPSSLSPTLLRTIVKESCQSAFPSLFVATHKAVRLEVAFETDRGIQKLNREYRGKDQPTDVLSFGNFSSRSAVPKTIEQTLDLGTLVLSLPFIRRSAREDGVSWKREFVYVFSHGVLHLLGFDHEPEMFVIQDQVTDKLAPVSKTNK